MAVFHPDKFFAHNIRVYVLAIGLAILSWILVAAFEPEPLILTTSSQYKIRSVDYFSTDYMKKELDTEGKLKSILQAQKLSHYKEDGITEMQQPIMTLYNANTPPWIIQATTGILAADGNTLHLNGAVSIDRAATENLPVLKLQTSDLTVKIHENYAEGKKWAQLHSGNNWIQGVGIQMVFKQPISLKLLSKVKSYYEPK